MHSIQWWRLSFSLLWTDVYFWEYYGEYLSLWSLVPFFALFMLWCCSAIQVIASMNHPFSSLRWCGIFFLLPWIIYNLLVFSMGHVSHSTWCILFLSDKRDKLLPGGCDGSSEVVHSPLKNAAEVLSPTF